MHWSDKHKDIYFYSTAYWVVTCSVTGGSTVSQRHTDLYPEDHSALFSIIKTSISYQEMQQSDDEK